MTFLVTVMPFVSGWRGRGVEVWTEEVRYHSTRELSRAARSATGMSGQTARASSSRVLIEQKRMVSWNRVRSCGDEAWVMLAWTVGHVVENSQWVLEAAEPLWHSHSGPCWDGLEYFRTKCQD